MGNNLDFTGNAPAVQNYGLVSVDENRAITEVQASMLVAKRYPRDQFAASNQILLACKRPKLAEAATYAYPRGNQTVTGPSIRLAEVLANSWGNIEYGYREINSTEKYTDVETFAFDKETNTRATRSFRVQHKREARGKTTDLFSPRDIYELVANQASRRIRACILQIIPADIVESAVEQCMATLASKDRDKPLIDRIRSMASLFIEYGVSIEMIEKRLNHKLEATIEQELVPLRQIYITIKNGAGKREDFFDMSVTLKDNKIDLSKPAATPDDIDITDEPQREAVEQKTEQPKPKANTTKTKEPGTPSVIKCPKVDEDVNTFMCEECKDRANCPAY